MTAAEQPEFLKIVAGPAGVAADPFLTPEARRAFPDPDAARWLRACRKLDGAGYGQAVTAAYARQAPPLALLVGTEPAIELADAVSSVAIRSGRKAAELLPSAALKAAERLAGDAPRFRSWLGIMQRLASLAPESLGVVLEKTEVLLGRLGDSGLNVSRLEAWVLAGIRLAGGDAERRLRYFSFLDPEAERWLQRESGEAVFFDQERRLKAYLVALWRLGLAVREPAPGASEQARRRAGFDGGLVRMPATFPGYRGTQAEEIFRASLAHIGAHLMYSGPKFPVGTLKPIQLALVSLIEDARVEHLALRDFPGLRRVWLPFHVAQASGALTAPSLLARLSRALIDPDFQDSNGWVQKARQRFFDREDDWEKPEISREIGGLLGNDLGQMRVQFNARTYLVEPPYRDDNQGLWDFGDEQPPENMEAELIFESARVEQREEEDQRPDQDRQDHSEEEEANRAAPAPEVLEAEGVPVARYPEYDYATGRERNDWTTVLEYQPRPGPARMIDEILESHRDIVNRLSGLIRSARVSRPVRLKRQAEGDSLDLDACIDAAIDRRLGLTPDTRVYSTLERRQRDLSVQVLIDISESTRDRIKGSTATVLDLERQATALLAHAMDELGDPFAIAAFCSNRREEVHYYRIKDFEIPYDGMARSALAGIEGGLSTRVGAALRHAGAQLRRQLSHRRLLLIITDGEPSDVDVTDRKYLVEDARKAVLSLAGEGIDVFCVGLDSGGDSYLSRIFGRRNVVQIDRLEALPERLPLLYLRLTA